MENSHNSFCPKPANLACYNTPTDIKREFTQLNEKSSQQSGSETSSLNAGFPEGETVQLGNVESLDITTCTVVGEDTCLGSSVNCSDSSLTTKNTKNYSLNSLQSKFSCQGKQLSTSTSTSRVETSEEEDIKCFNFLTQFNYSCSGCEFKSKDIISLREHKMNNHPQTKSEFADKKQSSVKYHETGTQFSSKSLVKVSRFNGEEKCSISSSGKEGQHESSINCVSLHQDTSKTHSASQVSALSDSQWSGSNSKPPSASLSMTKSRQSAKRHVRKWYPCSQCLFRTPNAKKLKAHLRENHLVTADASSAQSTRLAARQKVESGMSVSAIPDVSSSCLEKRLIKGHYFYLCSDANCPFRAKDSRAVLNHYRKNHPSPLARSDRKPQEMNKTTDSGQKHSYSCGLCKFSTNDKQLGKEHDLGHTKDFGYQCCICSFSVPTKQRLTFHIARDHSGGLSCDHCDYKAKTIAERNSHYASVHKTTTARNSSLRSSDQPSNSDCDLEHVCIHCSFKTSSRNRFQEHEKMHMTNTEGSSTEELDVVEDAPRKTTRKMKRKREDRESSRTLRSNKLIERLVYQCPHCTFWARAVSCFHQHLMVHEKTPIFKCSHCDFSARYRIAITKHIKKSPKKTHNSACWIMTKSVPENQYPEYLKTARVPELEYSGTSGIHAMDSDEVLKRETSSNCSDDDWKLSSESSVEDNSDERSVEWVPSSSLSSGNIKNGSFSSLSFEITSASSSEYGQTHSSTNTVLSSDSKSETEEITSTKSTPSTEKSSSTLTSGLFLRSSNRTKGLRRKRLRVDQDEEADQPHPYKTNNGSPENDTGNGQWGLCIPNPKDELQLPIPSDCLKCPFPVLDTALAKRSAKGKMVIEAQNKINKIQTEQLKMAEADTAIQSELLKLQERKHVVNKQLMILNGEKIEAELQLRTQQCQELKLTIVMCEPEQESEVNRNVLAECKNLVAESETKLTEIQGAIANLREENEILDCQIKESEESHAGTAQLVQIFQCELSEKGTELNLLQESLARTVSDVAQLVAKERTLIVARTAMCEEELKRLYEKGLSSIREKERDLLSALAGYVTDKDDSPNVKENV